MTPGRAFTLAVAITASVTAGAGLAAGLPAVLALALLAISLALFRCFVTWPGRHVDTQAETERAARRVILGMSPLPPGRH